LKKQQDSLLNDPAISSLFLNSSMILQAADNQFKHFDTALKGEMIIKEQMLKRTIKQKNAL